MSPATSPEDAVRRYLQWLEDPASLVDDDAVARAEAAVAGAADPLARLHALADLEHAREADADAVTEDFVAHAKGYADAESIPVAALQASGVPDDVLRRAGFEVGGRRRRSAGGSRRSGGASRAPKVSIEELKAATLRLPKQFTLADVASEAGGGSPQTVRKAVDEMIADGKARNLGPKQDHHGRGRAPTLYELV
ncbi:hypothetical protein PO878_08400 [Iamia majanohamensis]|uniref:Uncharacterized protein n=1 Tax=Iamia majanohamensis TaxID=467976 RepID=A0AAE9Y8K5_9ACTN|nr:hypothetical protein [Iamia majanohamensis]WCO68745.1 hypothetical protein PO878_08400 [Iamia majanohamensis]